MPYSYTNLVYVCRHAFRMHIRMYNTESSVASRGPFRTGGPLCLSFVSTPPFFFSLTSLYWQATTTTKFCKTIRVAKLRIDCPGRHSHMFLQGCHVCVRHLLTYLVHTCTMRVKKRRCQDLLSVGRVPTGDPPETTPLLWPLGYVCRCCVCIWYKVVLSLKGPKKQRPLPASWTVCKPPPFWIWNMPSTYVDDWWSTATREREKGWKRGRALESLRRFGRLQYMNESTATRRATGKRFLCPWMFFFVFLCLFFSVIIPFPSTVLY